MEGYVLLMGLFSLFSHFLQCHTSLLYFLQALELKSRVMLYTSQYALGMQKDFKNRCKLCEMMK